MKKLKELITKVTKILRDYYIPSYGISLNTENAWNLLEDLKAIEEELSKVVHTKSTIDFTDNSKYDVVDNPKHYNGSKYQCIDVMQDTYGKDAILAFCKLNAFKYIYRAEKKNGIEDMKKAVWYLNKYIDLNSLDK